MRFAEIDIVTTSQGVEVLTGLLEELGVSGLVVSDPADFEDFLNKTQTHWDYVDESLMQLRDAVPHITFYLPENGQGERQLADIKAAISRLRANDQTGLLGPLTLTRGSVAEEDWANNWKQYFKPLRVGKRLYIKPSWEQLDDDEGRIVLHIDPASSFGTGTHHTTQLCLIQLEQIPLLGARVLDMGGGSGILGIAAALLGAKEVTAVDIDENSVKTTGENAQKNSIDPHCFTLLCGDVTGNAALAARVGEGYDVVLANIVADVIIGMRTELCRFLRPGGILIASGIIGERADEVAAALTDCGLVIEVRGEQEDWVVLRCSKPL